LMPDGHTGYLYCLRCRFADRRIAEGVSQGGSVTAALARAENAVAPTRTA
jgi:hypothetical protein